LLSNLNKFIVTVLLANINKIELGQTVAIFRLLVFKLLWVTFM